MSDIRGMLLPVNEATYQKQRMEVSFMGYKVYLHRDWGKYQDKAKSLGTFLPGKVLYR